MAKSGRLELETIFTDNIGLYSTNVFGQQRNGNRRKTQNRAITRFTPFKVIQGHPRSSRSVPVESPYATSY